MKAQTLNLALFSINRRIFRPRFVFQDRKTRITNIKFSSLRGTEVHRTAALSCQHSSLQTAAPSIHPSNSNLQSVPISFLPADLWCCMWGVSEAGGASPQPRAFFFTSFLLGLISRSRLDPLAGEKLNDGTGFTATFLLRKASQALYICCSCAVSVQTLGSTSQHMHM